VIERADLLENEFFYAVTRLESSLVEINHSLYQFLQARCHLMILPLILD
jgi:hypothetical protein